MNPRSFLLSASGAFLALLAGVSAFADKPAAEVPEVQVIQPVVREVADYTDFTGRSDAALSITLRPRVTGYLKKVNFEDGAEVKEGEVLFEIDPRVYAAEFGRADAVLKASEARLMLAKANLDRALALAPKGGISQEELDERRRQKEVAEAETTSAKAGRDAAKLNLDFTKVTSPISGRIGRHLVDAGNLVKADDTSLGVIVSKDPMYVYFDVDERTALGLRKAIKDGKLKANALPVKMGLADEEGYPHSAVVDFMGDRVNPTTATVRMRAALSNADGILMPGMFVRGRLTTSEPRKVLLVPETAMRRVEDLVGMVIVVNEKNVVESRLVDIGLRHDGLRVVKGGLKAEDWVVLDTGLIKAIGSTVKPKKVAMSEEKPDKK